MVKCVEELLGELEVTNNQIEYYTNKKEEINKLIGKHEETLKKLPDVENLLYYNMVCKGLNKTKAVNKTVEQYNRDKTEREWVSIATVWRRCRELENKLKKS